MSLLGQAITLVTLPAVLAHEATHYALAWPVADDVSLHRPLSSRPSCRIVWGDAPDWTIVLAAYGPLVCGILLGVAGLLWAAVAGVGNLPRTTRTWLLTGVAAIWWGIYAYPSVADRQTAREVGGDG
jgi:hypothetical protein